MRNAVDENALDIWPAAKVATDAQAGWAISAGRDQIVDRSLNPLD